MRFGNQKKQQKTLFLPFIIAAAAVFLLCVAPVGAAELAAGTPVNNEETGVITIPVILKNDLSDFVGFSAKVANSIPGAVVTISSDQPITGAGYIVNSKDGQTEQYVNAMFYDEKSTTGISDAEITLFTLNIKITDPKVTSLPLDITLREILSASEGSIPLDTVKQINLAGLRLTDSVTADVTSVGKEEEPQTYIPPAPVLPEQTAQPGQPKQTVRPTAKSPADQTPASPGFGAAAGILGLLLGAGIIRTHQNRR